MLRTIIYTLILLVSPCILGTTTLSAQITDYRSVLDANGNLLVDDTPFMPVGFYCEGLPFEEYADIPARMAAGGFNCLYTESGVSSVAATDNFLQQCNSLGLKNFLGLPYSFLDPEDFDELVNLYKGYPSVIAWNMLDDANDFSATEINLQKERLLTMDTTRITSASWYTDGPLTDMLPGIEVASMQAYPWGSWGDLVASHAVFESMADTARLLNRLPLTSPQAFNWDDETYPPAAHLDCQTYLGFVTGMKGVLFYTFKDYDNETTIDLSQPELYAAASNIANEILTTEWKDVILFGEHEAHVIDFYRYYATWSYNDYVYLIAVNANANLSYDFDIPLPANVIGEPLNFFPSRPDDLSRQGEGLQGTLGPYQVAIYRLNTESTTTVDLPEVLSLRVHPNPTTDLIFIDGLRGTAQVKISDSTGRILGQQAIDAQQNQLDLRQFPTGSYTLEIRTKDGRAKASHQVIRQ